MPLLDDGSNGNGVKKKKANIRRKIEKTVSKTMGSIDAATTALNNYPELTDVGLDINANYSGNPLSFLFMIFKHLKGYDELVRIIGYMIHPLCYTLEYSVKAIFMARLTELLSCTLSKLRISEELINNGFTVNLKDVDLLNILLYSPLGNETTSSLGVKVRKKDENGNVVVDSNGDPVYEVKSTAPMNIGKYYYFGCEDFDKADDLVLCKDFNAVLWYVKNRANGRVVWYGSEKQPFVQLANETASNVFPMQQQKRDGILTLEYHDSGKSLTKADGSPYYQQAPSENCLHVFIGNTREVPTDSNIVRNKKAAYAELDKWERFSVKYWELVGKLEKERKRLVNILEKGNELTTSDSYVSINDDIRNLNIYIELLYYGNMTVGNIFGEPVDRKVKAKYGTGNLAAYDADIEAISLSDIRNNIASNSTSINVIEHNDVKHYRPARDNYYNGKFMMTFNSDYIWSVKLFDEKVVAAQLIDALTGCLEMNANISLETRILKAEIRKIVEEISGSDTYHVSDCFFTFTNQGYNDLLEKAELAKMGLYMTEGDCSTISKVDADRLLEGLDSVSEKKENISEIVTETLVTAGRLIRDGEGDITETSVDGQVSFSFVENLMNKLATVIVTCVVSPKLYVMLLVNLQVMKLNTHLDIVKFIESYKGIMTALVLDIRNQLVKMFTDKIMDILRDITKELFTVLTAEQMNYYLNLVLSCMNCIKLSQRQSSNDWTMADVDYADIYEQEDKVQDDNKC